MHAEENRALSAGFQLHMAKPIDPAELTAVIARVVAVERGNVNRE